MSDEIDYFKTTDLNLAATLHAINFPIDGIWAKNALKKSYEFYFKKTPELEEQVIAYWNNTLRVSPLSVFSSRRELLAGLKAKQQYEQEDSEKPA